MKYGDYEIIINHLYFEAIEPMTVSFSRNDIEYSLDKKRWKTLPAGVSSPLINVGKKIYFKASGLVPMQDWEEENDYDQKVMTYLHGACDYWVVDHYQIGDKPVIWACQNEENNKLCLIHCFINRNGEFFDVRGNTSSIDDIQEGFEDFTNGLDVFLESENIEEFKKRLRETFGYDAAIWK